MNHDDERRRCQLAIQETIAGGFEPWLHTLTPLLVDFGWQTLQKDIGLVPETYSTAAVVRRRRIVSNESSPELTSNRHQGCFGTIEYLPSAIQAHYSSSDYGFRGVDPNGNDDLAEALSLAESSVAQVPSLFSSVRLLINRIHILQSGVEDCDISFSDPMLPFSIFVSVPERGSPNASIRLAEAIIHEAMHLQFSLMECVAPLAKSQEPQFYSPWKRSKRSTLR